MSSPQTPPDPLLTTEEVASICRTSPSTVRYWRYTGYGPRGFRAGRRVLYRSSEVARWIEQRADYEAKA